MVQSNKEMQKHKDFSQKKAKWGKEVSWLEFVQVSSVCVCEHEKLRGNITTDKRRKTYVWCIQVQ